MVFTMIFGLLERTFQISVEKCISCLLYCLEIKEHVCRQKLVNVHDNNYQCQRKVWKFVSLPKFKEMLFQPGLHWWVNVFININTPGPWSLVCIFINLLIRAYCALNFQSHQFSESLQIEDLGFFFFFFLQTSSDFQVLTCVHKFFVSEQRRYFE